MGRSVSLVVVLVLVRLLSLVLGLGGSLCDYSQCSCERRGQWLNAVCLFNSTQKQLELTSQSAPWSLAELELSGPRELVICGSFSRNLSALNLVRLSDLGSLTVQKTAFARLASPQLRLEVAGVQRVILETGAFSELRTATVSARLERVGHMIVQEFAFDRLLELEILRVGRLELKPSAFYCKTDPSKESQGPVTKITLDRVSAKELPQSVFPILNQLLISNSVVDVVRGSAFNAIEMTTVTLRNTTVRRVESDAFTSRCRITTLRLDGVSLGQLQSNSVCSGISRLLVTGSSLSDVAETAFNTIAATVSLTQNIFNTVHSRGLTLEKTTSLTVEHNTFNVLEDSAFHLPLEGDSPPVNITFRNNNLGRDIRRNVLDFTHRKQPGSQVYNNSFAYECQCENSTRSWLRERMSGPDSVMDELYSTSLCVVSRERARCAQALGVTHVTQGLFAMDNFSASLCSEDRLECPAEEADADVDRSIPGTTSDININDVSAARERKLLGTILLAGLAGVLAMLLLSGVVWLRRRGYCAKARLHLAHIISHRLTGTGGAGGNAAGVVSSGHDYAELQVTQILTEESAEEDVPLEDKATQTLPEELTQELLQTLREKLDDPDNYGEARDMIEHLYDLIKVEESCNQNSEFTSLQLEDETVPEAENVYDVIQPRRTKKPREKRSMVSVGTRAPSPDKLLPLSLGRAKRAELCDYAEPRDRQVHVYQELPSAHDLASRPLPPAPAPSTLQPSVILT